MSEQDIKSNIREEIIRIALGVQRVKRPGVLDEPIRSKLESDNIKELAKKVIQEYNKLNQEQISNVNPWIWNKKTSGGSALTKNGEQNGFELRFSYYKSKVLKPENISKTKTTVYSKTDGLDIKKLSSSHETFDPFFNRLVDAAVSVAGFPVKKPPQADRLPSKIKSKVANLWKMGICYADVEDPARFRIADSKEGKGGPYKWFSYNSRTKNIYINFEYFVQVAGFHDLVVEYGYPPKWMKFEYHESVPPVSLATDIGIIFPDGRKAFVEVKETGRQWESLIAEVKSLGKIGVDISAADRGNDPLRKAKYIIAGHPDFFVGYHANGVDAYKVLYQSKTNFILEPCELPKFRDIIQSDVDIKMIKKLISFLQEGVQKPLEVINYLESRRKCSKQECKRVGCEALIPYFSAGRWNQRAIDYFFEWSWRWYTNNKYEEPFYIVFILSRVAQFLEIEMGWDEQTILQNFKMEFKGRLRVKRELPIPSCLWKGGQRDKQASVYIENKFLNAARGSACDFYIKQPFTLIAEVKVAVLSNAKQVFNGFLKDIEKCRNWLKSETSLSIDKKFGLSRFNYALALLIDLTGEEGFSSRWNSIIDETALLREGIFARLVSPIWQPGAGRN